MKIALKELKKIIKESLAEANIVTINNNIIQLNEEDVEVEDLVKALGEQKILKLAQQTLKLSGDPKFSVFNQREFVENYLIPMGKYNSIKEVAIAFAASIGVPFGGAYFTL